MPTDSQKLHDRTLHKTFDKVSAKLQESNHPVRDFKADQGLGPWTPSCLHAWSDANHIVAGDRRGCGSQSTLNSCDCDSTLDRCTR